VARSGYDKIKQYFDIIDGKGGQARRWDFVKIAGNETNLQRWEAKLCDEWKLVKKYEASSEDDRSRTYYTKTPDGQKLHDLLNTHSGMDSLFQELGRQRLRPSNWYETDADSPFG
jgi:hypothetical protein